MFSNSLPRLLSLTFTFISHDSKPCGAVPGILFSLNHRELDPTHQTILDVLKNKTYEVPFHTSQNGCDPKVYK